MATRSAKKTTDVAAPAAAPVQDAIPAAVRPAAKKASAADLLAGLSGKAPTKKPAAAKAKERPVLALSDEVKALYAEYAPAKELWDVLDARLKSLKGELNPELFTAWVALMWQKKTLPSNPNIEVKNENDVLDCKGMFIVQERIKVQIPDNNDPTGSVVELLVKSGVGQAEAEELVNEEIDFTPQTGLRPFNELVSGHYEAEREFVEATAAEQAVGQKLLEFVTNNLSPEEQALVLLNTPKTVVKKGFLTRVCKYAHTQEQLAAILQVLVPVVQNKGAKFGVSDTPVTKTQRLVEYTGTIIGAAPVADDEEDDD